MFHPGDSWNAGVIATQRSLPTVRGVTARLLTELSAPAIASSLGPDSVLVLPTGAIEQHGPHLPVATDLITAQSLAERAVEQFGDELDLWLLPPLAYTKSNEHAWSGGTFWLSAATLTAVLADLGRSVAMTPARRLAFLNGHGGNSALLQVAARDIRLATGLRTFTLHPALPADHGGESPADELGMGVHGGLEETSLMLHLRPELVDMSRADRWVPEHLDGYRHVRFGGSVSFGWSSDDFGPSGVIGDARRATAERGAARVEGMVAHLGEAFAEVARFDPTPPAA
jgi:creatinine amidohydrolase